MDTKLKKLSPFERVPTYFLIQHETVRPDAIIYSLSELDFVVKDIVEKNEQKIVDFFNNASFYRRSISKDSNLS